MSILLFVASSANKYAKCKQICLQICCIFLILEDHFLSEQLVTGHCVVVDDVGSNAARHTFFEQHEPSDGVLAVRTEPEKLLSYRQVKW